MNKLADMKLFCMVVENGSFAQTAKVIDMTPAIVGRRISRLEDTLGFKLFNRTTRQMNITPAGQSYYEGCNKILDEISELENSLTSQHLDNPGGLIRLSAPDSLASVFLIEAIKSFQSFYPDIRFDLRCENQHLDLIEDDLDLNFRLAVDLIDSSYVAIKLLESTLGLYAAPDYLSKHGIPKNIHELASHDCINMGASRYGGHWNILLDGEPARFKQPWKLVVSNGASLLQALTSGMGIGMVPTLFAQPHLEDGSLTVLTDIVEFPGLGLYLMYPSRKHIPYRLTLFLEFIKLWFADK